MTSADEILDGIVRSFEGLEATLSGDDSPLASVWDEIKEQVQHETSVYWDSYKEMIRAAVEGTIDTLNGEQRRKLRSELELDGEEAVSDSIEEELLSRLLARAGREEINLPPFDFRYFSLQIHDFCAYGEVLRRTGLGTCDRI